ncbi:hypothetical protein FRB93_009810 [Tulasnella sp. JGI-2019a]|nr:hypothetical protein FRB93_009810 [Tulasnella sp. JGI-2019a]
MVHFDHGMDKENELRLLRAFFSNPRSSFHIVQSARMISTIVKVTKVQPDHVLMALSQTLGEHHHPISDDKELNVLRAACQSNVYNATNGDTILNDVASSTGMELSTIRGVFESYIRRPLRYKTPHDKLQILSINNMIAKHKSRDKLTSTAAPSINRERMKRMKSTSNASPVISSDLGQALEAIFTSNPELCDSDMMVHVEKYKVSEDVVSKWLARRRENWRVEKQLGE